MVEWWSEVIVEVALSCGEIGGNLTLNFKSGEDSDDLLISSARGSWWQG